MKNLAERRPLIFSLSIVAALLVFAFVSRIIFPATPVGDVSDLPPEALRQPTEWEKVLSALKSAENLFWILSVLLAAALLSWLGWWHEAGFNRPSRWHNLHLLWFPLAVVAFALSDGVEVPGPGALTATLLGVLVAVIGEETIFRGVVWRTFIPRGPMRAMIVTSLLSGALQLLRSLSDGPWPETVFLTIAAACAGFTYAALRWRTASLWPVILIHAALAFATDISTLDLTTYQILLLLTTLGFLLYGLFLLRNQQVRADGG